MTSRYSQFKEQLPVSQLSEETLLAFRVLFDDPLDIVDLAQDIADLALFPERLKDSYRKEWEAYVLKSLAMEIKKQDNVSPAEFIEQMMSKVEEIQQNNAQWAPLHDAICAAESLSDPWSTPEAPL